QEGFERHLVGCASCSAELGELLQLEALVGEAIAGPRAIPAAAPGLAPIRPLRARPRRWQRALLSAATTAVAAAAAFWILVGTPAEPELSWKLGPTRIYRARFSYQPAAGYRPLAVMRGGAEHSERAQVDLAVLARLEKAGDRHGLAAGQALNGNLGAAADQLA